MTRYLLDTDVLIDVTKDWRGVAPRIRRLLAEGHQLGVCAVNLCEFYSGVPTGADAPAARLLEVVEFWPITAEAARQAGRDRYALARRGIAVSTPDCLISAVSKEVGATLLTRDHAHRLIPGVDAQPPEAFDG